MRIALTCLLLASTSVLAAPPTAQFDPVQFEKRFHKADADKDGRLNRKEAYGEFPRMPEFFDEIDRNGDNAITLPEVQQAMERRVDAAFRASGSYGSPAVGKAGDTVGGTAQEPVPLSELETKRALRNQYYESLADDTERARDQGEVVPRAPSTPLIDKRF